MHRPIGLPLLVALALCGCGRDAPAPFQSASDGDSTLTVEGGIAVLRLRGDARERGAAHGRLLRDSIRAALERLRPVESSMVPFAIDDCSGRLLRFVPPELRAELEGLAAGSGLTLNEIVFLNARFELAQFRLVGKGDGRQRLLQAAAVGPGPSVVRRIDPADLDGLADTVLVVTHDTGAGDRLVTVTLPGLAGALAGLCGETAATLRPVPVSGTPDLSGLVWPLFLRLVLEQPGAFAPGGELVAKPTLSASIPVIGARTGLLQVAPPGATWYPSADGRAVAGEAEVTASDGRIDEGARLPGEALGDARENHLVVRLERTPEGVRVEFTHAGERKTRVLR